MAQVPISQLATFPGSPTSATGTSADEIEFLDVNDTSMAPTGTNKRVNMADFFSTFITAGSNVTVTKQTAGRCLDRLDGFRRRHARGSSGQIQYDNGGAFGGFTMSGDATLVTSTGVITVSAGDHAGQACEPRGQLAHGQSHGQPGDSVSHHPGETCSFSGRPSLLLAAAA